MTSWNYNIQTTSTYGSAPNVTAPAASPEPAAPRYSAEQISLLNALVRDPANSTIASQVLEQVNNAGLGNNERDGARVLDIINTAFGSPVRLGEPVGNDVMTASPTTLAVATALGEQRLLEQSGRDSTNERDLELMKSRVENRVKELMANGASRDEIAQVARNYGSTPALADAAAEMAVQQYDANRNPLADAAPQLIPATPQTARPGENGLQNLLVGLTAGQNFVDEETRRLNSYRPLSYPIGGFATVETTAIGSNTAPSYALLGDLTPTPGLPPKINTGRGGPDFA